MKHTESIIIPITESKKMPKKNLRIKSRIKKLLRRKSQSTQNNTQETKALHPGKTEQAEDKNNNTKDYNGSSFAYKSYPGYWPMDPNTPHGEPIMTEIEPGIYITTGIAPVFPPTYEDSQLHDVTVDEIKCEKKLYSEQHERLIPTAPPADAMDYQPPPYRSAACEYVVAADQPMVYQPTTIVEKRKENDIWRWEKRTDKRLPKMGVGWKAVIGTGVVVFSPVLLPVAILCGVTYSLGICAYSYLLE